MSHATPSALSRTPTRITLIAGVVSLGLIGATSAWAQTQGADSSVPVGSPPAGASGGAGVGAGGGMTPKRRVDVDRLKKQYWTQSGEFDVVQNRLYSKSGRMELTAFGGTIATDPFLSVRSVGGTLGYYFNETFSLRAVAWKYIVSDSDAKTTIRQQNNVTPNDNIPSTFFGGEFRASAIYGKLSLLGKAILYYDLQVALGGGIVNTETGNNFAQTIGVGQKIFLSNSFSIDLDYRLMRYNETIVNKVPSIPNPNLPTTRTNWSNVVMLGIGLMF